MAAKGLTAEDRLLNKALRISKVCAVDKMIAEFSVRQWKWHTLYNLVRRFDPTYFAVIFVFR